MIKLFRNIRKKFLSEGKTNNYLKYAIGEIILVVIGILIALQINNWNQNRIENNRARKLLKNMVEDLATDTLMLNQSITNYEFQSNNCVKLLNDSLFANTKADSIFFMLPLNQAGLLLTTQAFDKINNASLTSLLGSSELDQAISEYYITSAEYAEKQFTWEEQRTNKDEDFWLDALQMEIPQYFKVKNNPSYKQSESERKQELLRVIASTEGRQRIRFALDRKQMILYSIKIRKEMAIDLISQIKKYL
ncbi:DUF6090 family protein [Winogradskyella sp. SYSU M77433]|uniref:DUF6090 family protein n=1 Tax=Winogradskyella sp. SYSU M77433 TaxID=3042722 RepID=UPI002480AE5F|nr:DUF6090 family protein [Winogradskyella sp. SYSU M77433]MDH7914450.1 DUF6090 family protein [Winogradskyella sp. SYSU M77433]